MARQERHKTKYPGVYFISGKSTSGRQIKRYYVVFKRDGKVHEEAARVIINDGPDTRPAETPQEASAWRSRRIEEVSRARNATNGDITVDQTWTMRTAVLQSSSPSTASYYKNHIQPKIGHKRLRDVTDLDVDTIGKQMLDDGYAPATVWQVMTIPGRLQKWAIKKKLVSMVPVDPDLPTFDNQVTENMTPAQLLAYWDTLAKWPVQHDADFFRIAILTGVRKTALASVMWTDIDFETGFLTLRAATAKNGKEKKIPLPSYALRIFRAMHRGKSPYVWPGKTTHRRNFTFVGGKIRDAAGLPKDFRPCHGLRHTFASTLASSGKVDLYTLQHLLTHSSAAMTQRYAHLTDDAFQRAASVTDDTLIPSEFSINDV